MAVPYIGVTGIIDQNLARVLAQAFPYGANCKLMVGICSSQKMLREGANRYPHLFPRPGDIRNILTGDPRVIQIIHYYADRDSTLAIELFNLSSLVCSPDLHGFQLNIPWPNPDQLERLRTSCGPFTYILALDKGALAQEGNDPSRVVQRLRQYAGFIDYVLLDPSRGEGKPLDAEWAMPYLDAFASDQFVSTLGLVVAGGLGPDSLDPYLRILERHPSVSCDAQGKLQDPNTKLVRADFAAGYIYKALWAQGIEPVSITG